MLKNHYEALRVGEVSWGFDGEGDEDWIFCQLRADQRGHNDKDGWTFVLHIGGNATYRANKIASMKASNCSEEFIALYEEATAEGFDKLFIVGR
jgi:hypothetical protein